MQVAGGRENFWPVLQFLSDLTASGGTDLYRCTKEFVANFPSRGIAMVISDFFDEEGARRSMEVLRSAGHDFVIVQVHSADEQRPSAFGELMLEEAETGIRRTIECSREKAALYEKAFLEFSSQLAASGRAQRRALRARGHQHSLPGFRAAKPAQRTGAGMSLLALTPLQVLALWAGGVRAGAVALFASAAGKAARFHLALLGRSAAQRLPAPPLAPRALGLAGASSSFCCC